MPLFSEKLEDVKLAPATGEPTKSQPGSLDVGDADEILFIHLLYVTLPVEVPCTINEPNSFESD